MTPKDYIAQGDLEKAMQAAKEDVKAKVADGGKRVFLTQLQFVMGAWKDAMTNLDILQDMDTASSLFARMYKPVVESEMLRVSIFAGNVTPIIFGEPEPWMGELVHANQLLAQGNVEQFDKLQAKAFQKAPANGGSVDGAPFEWIADADSRIGPILEVIMEGGYRWIPFSRISKIKFEPTTDLRDLVWRSCYITLSNGGVLTVFVPVRYPGSEDSESHEIRLARRTEWIEKSSNTALGQGQRILTTNNSDYPLLDIKEITFPASKE
jgi:type VI secretion system protein ImpE